MSDFTDKIKEEAQKLSAAIDQELTVLEGVDGIDPLARDDEAAYPLDENAPTAEPEAPATDDTEGGGASAS